MRVGRYEGTAGTWNSFVQEQEGATPFHQAEWRDILGEIHGHDCPYLAAWDDGDRLRGVLPLVRVKSPLFGHYLVSMPFLNYGGPLGQDAAIRRLTEAAAELARSEGADLLELRSRDPVDTDLDVSHRKITVILDLPEGGSEVLWEDLASKVRNQVRRPRKEGVEVAFGGDQLEPFYRVFARHMRDLGTPAQPLAFFREMEDVFGERMWFGAAWLDGEPVAGGCGFRWDGEFEITWASDLMEHRRIAPNMLLYWSFIARACDEGLERFNFGRCTPDSGTHRFKRQWGTRDEQLWWYQWSGDGGAQSTPSPEDDAWSWGPRLWRKIPVAVATRLGPRIVRYIP